MRTRLLHLDSRPERLRSFKQNNPHVGTFELFDAIDGALAHRPSLTGSGVIAANLGYSDAVLGSALTHLMQWRDTIGDDVVTTVIEDNAILAPDFAERTGRLLRSLGDEWDYVLWGWDDTAPTIFEPGPDDGRSGLAVLRDAAGAVGYSISPQGAGKLLDRCLPLRGETIDAMVASAWSTMAAYVAVPALAVADPAHPADAAGITRVHEPSIERRLAVR